MGGNAIIYNKNTGKETRAQKIPISQIGRARFVSTLVAVFKKMNSDFEKRYGRKIWTDESVLQSGIAFNGSTSFIMSPEFSDEDIEKFKPSAGDLDIAVDETVKKELEAYLDSIEDKEIIPGVKYVGKIENGFGDQFNTIFLIEFKKDLTIACQVDFELLPYENEKPTEWSRFSRSSSFEDTKRKVKAVFHKYLISSLVGVAGMRKDIVIATDKSTPDKVVLSKNKVHELPRMYKFSVNKGLRMAYEPLIDPKTGKVVEITVNGVKKSVFKSVSTKDSKFMTSVEGIMQMALGIKNAISPQEKKLFWSFEGICMLIKKYIGNRKDFLETLQDRFENKVWGSGSDYAQEIERNDPVADYAVKIDGYRELCKKLNLRDNSKKIATEYYKKWKNEGQPEEVLKLLK